MTQPHPATTLTSLWNRLLTAVLEFPRRRGEDGFHSFTALSVPRHDAWAGGTRSSDGLVHALIDASGCSLPDVDDAPAALLRHPLAARELADHPRFRNDHPVVRISISALSPAYLCRTTPARPCPLNGQGSPILRPSASGVMAPRSRETGGRLFASLWSGPKLARVQAFMRRPLVIIKRFP